MEATKASVPGSVSSKASTTLSMARIKLDSDLQVRVTLSKETIAAYANEMQEGAEFPPVDVFHDGSDYWLANGFHRYNATESIGHDDIAVRIHQGSKRDAMLFAISADIRVGLRRSNEDKNKAVGLLFADDEWKTWSDGKLAKLAGVSDRFVAKIRKELTPNGSEISAVKYTKNGKDQIMSLPKKIRSKTQEPKPEADACEAGSTVDDVPSLPILINHEVTDSVGSSKVGAVGDVAKTMYHRKISNLEALAIDFSDELDAILTKERVPDDKAIAAVGDAEVLVKRFLEKFNKGEV